MGRENLAKTAFDLPREPETTDILRVLSRRVKLSIRTHVPAKVIAYDAATQKATVEVATKQVVKVVDLRRIPPDAESVEGVPPTATATRRAFILPNVPVVWPRTIAGYITFPLVAGDTGELHVGDRDLTAWIKAGVASRPVQLRTHDLADSVFHPGLHADTNPITPATSSTATVVAGTAQVQIGSTLATESATKAESLLTALIAAVTAAPTVPMDGGASFKSGLLAQLATMQAQLGTPAGIGSTKVKVDS